MGQVSNKEVLKNIATKRRLLLKIKKKKDEIPLIHTGEGVLGKFNP